MARMCFLPLLALTAEAAVDGTLTMWTSRADTILGSSCRYVDPRGGGFGIPHSSYINERMYCAVSADLYQGGTACGKCYKLIYDGKNGLHGTPHGHSDSVIVQVVDSGAGSSKHFDCQLTAFTDLTHTSPGIFPIRYEPARCHAEGAPAATVLQGGNPWSVIVLFSKLPSPAAKAEITVDGHTFKMQEGFSAAWRGGVYLPNGATREHTTVSFKVQLRDGSFVTFENCFYHWPVSAGDSCNDHHHRLESASLLLGANLPLVHDQNSRNQTAATFAENSTELRSVPLLLNAYLPVQDQSSRNQTVETVLDNSTQLGGASLLLNNSLPVQDQSSTNQTVETAVVNSAEPQPSTNFLAPTAR